MSITGLSYDQYFAVGQAQDTRAVSSVTGRNVALVTSYVDEPIPRPVVVRTTRGVEGMINIAGATSIKTAAEREMLFNFVLALFGGNPEMPFHLGRISLGSGGTRVIDSETTEGPLTGRMTAVETPGIAYMIAQQYSDNPADWPLTWGHTPRTNETLGYGGEHSSFFLAEELETSAIPNPLLHLLWIIEKSASQRALWNTDLPLYVELLRIFQASGEGNSGLLVLSGGGVTAEEVKLAMRDGIPVLGAVGTGRAADALDLLLKGRVDEIEEKGIRDHYQEILDDSLDLDLISLCHTSRPTLGQNWMQNLGFGHRTSKYTSK